MRFTKSLLLVSLLALPSLAQADWRSALRTTFAQEDTDLGALYCPLTENTKCLPAGKEITTTRPSSCMTYTGSENAPGGASWVTRGEDEACVDASGLQAFGGFTNYAVNGADPTASSWTRTQILITPLADGYRVAGQRDGTVRLYTASHAGLAGETWTASCEIRRAPDATTTTINLRPASLSTINTACTVPLTSEWSIQSCTRTLTASGDVWALLEHLTGTGERPFEFRACWLTKTPRPMPRHDCGPSPCSRAGEVHTVDASGWSTDSFDIRVQYEPGLWPPGGNQVLVRTDAVYVAVQSSGLAILRANGVSAADGVAAVPANSNSRDYRASYDGGVWTLCVDGACSSGPGPAPNPHGVAYLGAADAAAIQPANGHIRLLRVSGGTE